MICALLALALGGCGAAPDADRTVEKSSASERAARRAHDGAPPVIPHARIGVDCVKCHDEQGIEVEDLGFAPPTPHGLTAGIGDRARCEQCHVYRVTDDLFAQNEFVAAPQVWEGEALYEGGPPVIPHAVFMRENCVACHDGLAAREEIRAPHPERDRCEQCHVPSFADGDFVENDFTP